MGGTLRWGAPSRTHRSWGDWDGSGRWRWAGGDGSEGGDHHRRLMGNLRAVAKQLAERKRGRRRRRRGHRRRGSTGPCDRPLHAPDAGQAGSQGAGMHPSGIASKDASTSAATGTCLAVAKIRLAGEKIGSGRKDGRGDPDALPRRGKLLRRLGDALVGLREDRFFGRRTACCKTDAADIIVVAWHAANRHLQFF
ncbi:hypothetical protein Pla52o_09040 [Novipirellula galeiformis]|uniref:Uncharacterized protein n=1 Tax=Novipirellula galeiformis TaxID=2528004 RepID=A0A5C6CT39_9BACT|nr:hypothetical protein Pla52o_09040 [Novipirellula galeiformis]